MSWSFQRTTPISHYHQRKSGLLQRLHIDATLLILLISLSSIGILILMSSGHEDIGLLQRQATRLGIAFFAMLVVAQIPPHALKIFAPWLFLVGTLLLLGVLFMGDIGKGAQRWLDLGFFRFQPSELLKLATPMMVAWYLAERRLPPSIKHIVFATVFIAIPTVLIAKQPDLGTAILIASSGLAVLFLAGISWRLIMGVIAVGAGLAPVLWSFMKEYQKQRVLTFISPEDDPLGAGYHIIQSKIAIGSGGVYGKGWMNGSQARLEFLPESSTDFIFAVFSEEFGLIGCIVLLTIYLLIFVRSIYIAIQAQDTFSRLLAGSLSFTFFIYLFVNVAMVTGLLPVVGVPLPLVSYGGTSMVTLLIGFGILMSIHTHRKLLSS
ncbi:MAG: rod shape-determining protein RodA [Cycloclasticus sp. symbiont of Bathymodiolus heckerae]|nr:MAG: rod shape-determining protein RodA [Cycloclasticus sp. symbiont of Bathymodiolus heckerae]